MASQPGQFDLVGEAAHHVEDATKFELPFGTEIPIPQPPPIFGVQFEFTKYMVLELVVAILMVAIFVPLARRLCTGEPLRGRLGNLFEAVLLFIRDEMARPAIGRHDADRFLPYLWTAFFFILFCNLIGLIPWAGSPTGAVAVTATLAAFSFILLISAALRKLGAVGFVRSFVPHMDLPRPLAIFLVPMIFVLELGGLIIRHGVLAVRLLANMFAGHLVLAVILLFIKMTADSVLWYGVLPASIVGAIGINLLELLVAFLQAYIFTFLSALFIGMAVHPH